MFLLYKKIGTIDENNNFIIDTQQFPNLPKVSGSDYEIDEKWIRQVVYAINEFFVNENLLKEGYRDSEPIAYLTNWLFLFNNYQNFSYCIDTFSEVSIEHGFETNDELKIKLNIKENGVYIGIVSRLNKNGILARAYGFDFNNVGDYISNFIDRMYMSPFIFRYPSLNNKELYHSYYDKSNLDYHAENNNTPVTSIAYPLNGSYWS